MRVLQAAVIEPRATERRKLVTGLSRAGFRVTEATEPDGLKSEQVVLLGPGALPFAKVTLAVRKRLPKALVLQGQARLTRAAHADAVVPLPLSPRDLQVRLPELFRWKQKGPGKKPASQLPRVAPPPTVSSVMDPLTGFYLFPIFKEILFIEVKRARRHGLPLSIAMLALDAMPAAAATREQRSGGLSLAVRRSLRDTDFPVQYSADRILLVMSHTELAGAITVCQRICERVSRISVPHRSGVLHPTLSVGIAGAATPGKELSFADLVHNAQASLQRALSSGGNRVEFYDRAEVDNPPEPGNADA